MIVSSLKNVPPFPTIPINGQDRPATVALQNSEGQFIDWALCGTPADLAETIREWEGRGTVVLHPDLPPEWKRMTESYA